MALSNDLINQFVKLTNQEEKPKETTVNGTYKVVNGEEFVQLDGSEIWTPVTSTVEAETGERVKVTIKNHTATVTGNISSPSARSKSVKDLKDEVDEQGNTIKEIDNTIERQGNSIIQINNDIQQVNNTISQHDNAISQHGNTIQQINNTIEQQGNDITQLNNDIEQQGNDITQINNTITQHGNTITQHGNTITQQGNTITQQGNTISQQGNTITQQGNTIAEHNTAITTANSNIQILNSGFVINNGVLTGLSQIVVDDLETQHLDATYANIDFANINAAAVRKVFSDSGIIKDLVVQQGKITGELVGVTIKGDLIEGNTIKAEKLVVRGEDGLYYKLNLDGMDNISTTQASKFTLLTETPSDWSTNYTDYYTVSNNKYVHVSGNSAPTWAANTYYKLNSEHQNGLDGTVIIAKSITADKVQVSDLVAFDATIGGFHIGDHSLYSGVKSSVSNTTRGIYMDDSGQFNIGDSNNFIKYFLDTSDNTYKLNISAGVIHMGGSNKTLQQTIDEIEQSVDNVEIGGRNLLIGTKTQDTTKGNYRSNATATNETFNQCTIFKTSGAWDDIGFNLKRLLDDGTLKPGDNVTYSIYAKTDDTTSRQIKFYCSSTVNGSAKYYYVDNAKSEHNNNIINTYGWTKYYYTFEIKEEMFTDQISNNSIVTRMECTTGSTSGNYIYWAAPKLERGNKPTDWSLAPEDVEDSIDKVEVGGRNLLQYTGYDKTTSDGITIRGSYATPSIVSDDKPIGSKSKTLKIITTASAVSGTKDIWQKCWNLQIYQKSIKLSLYVKGSVSAKAFFRLAGSYSSKSSANFQYDVTTSWKKLEIDLGTITNDISTGESEIIYGFNTAGTFYINSMKLEYGDKFTDWTPAPEDVDSLIAKTVKTVDVEYYLSTSSSSATGGSWTTIAPAWVNGKYMWSRQKVTYVDNTTATRNETCIAGATGATGPTGATGGTGATGATGTGVDSIIEEFYLSTSKTTQTGGSWVTTPPTWSSGKYIWTRSKIIYKNPSSTVYTTPLCSSEWEAVNEVEIGGRNLILRSDTFEKSSETWSIGNGITIQDSDINNVKEITMSRTGATGDTWNRAIPHRYLTIDEINQNSKGVLVSFDLKIDDISSIDHGCICALQIFNSSNSRIGWFEGASIISGDLYNTKLSEFTNGVWKRVCVRFSQQDLKRVTVSGHTVDEVAYTSISFQLVRNGSIHIRCPKMEFGDKATDWTPAPEDFQNAISDVSKSISEVIVGTQTASTGSWTGIASFDSLSDGQQITYWLPYAGSGNATLNLTLSNGTTTGAIPCYYQGASRLTTHYPAGSVIHLTYRVNANVNGTNYTGWWGDANYDSNNTNLLRFQQKIKVLEAISAGQIITGTSTGYKKLAVNVSFDLDKPILVASSTLVANATGDNNYIVRPDVNIRTTNGNGSWTATQYEVLYLVGTISGNTFTPTSPFLTTTKPTSESNLYYISLGYMYSTYQIILYPEHPIFKYIDGQFKNISQIAYEAFTSEVGGTNRLIGSSIYREDTPAGFVDEVRNDANKTLPQMQFIPIPDEFYVIQVKTDLPISNAHGYNSNTIGKFTLCFYIRNTGSTKSWGQYDSAICFSSADNSTTKRYLGSKNNNTYYWLYKIPSNAMDVCIRINTYADSNNPITGNFWDFKIEQGNKATDWSPPPEDIDSSIGDAQTVALDAKSAVDVVKDVANQASVDIESIKGYIQNLVVDQNGQSMMTQTGKGWQFNMGTINGNLNSLSKAVDDMSNDNEDTKALLDNVKSLAESVADKTAYINVDYTIDASGNPIPRMILGAETSAFKIRITNESIDFMESDTVMAYATSNTFYNLTTVVQKELQIGSGPAYIWSVRANGNMGLTYKSNSAIS